MLLVLTSVYGLADSIIPNVTPLPVISPSSTAVAHPGTTFSLLINVGGVSNLSGFQFSFSFNPSVISATSMIAGLFLSGMYIRRWSDRQYGGNNQLDYRQRQVLPQDPAR